VPVKVKHINENLDTDRDTIPTHKEQYIDHGMIMNNSEMTMR
jgi:hypothetical protein